MIQCPKCTGTNIYRVRHDSDWGSTNTMYRVNPLECYPIGEKEDEEYGDINFLFCKDCFNEWF